MTFRDARELFRFWQDCPPEAEMLSLLARAYTTWEPTNAQPATPEEHMASLERRWRAGAMNPKQIFEAMGGALAVSMDINGVLTPVTQIGGIGPLPGAP